METTTCLTFLGIEFEKMDRTLRLPICEEKLMSHSGEFKKLYTSQITLRDLKSFIGILNFASQVD